MPVEVLAVPRPWQKIKTSLARSHRERGPAQPRRDVHARSGWFLNLGKAKVQPSRMNLTPAPSPQPVSRSAGAVNNLLTPRCAATTPAPRPPATLHTDRDRAVRHRGAVRELPGPTLERRQRPTSCRATGRSRVRRSGLDNYRASAGQRCRRDPHSRDHQSPPDWRRLGWPASHRPLNSCANRP